METNNISDYIKTIQDSAIKSKTFATIAGTVASISSIVVAGNILLGNGLEALQVGGTTIAMASYLIGYSKISTIHQKRVNNLQNSPSDSLKTILEDLKDKLETYKTAITMDQIVGGAFYVSTIGHLIELLTIKDMPSVVTNIALGTLAALVGTLHIFRAKNYQQQSQLTNDKIECLEELQECEKLLNNSESNYLILEDSKPKSK